MIIKDIKADSKIHMVGIGGISMSGIAEILLDAGYRVSGSDRVLSAITEKLASLGAVIYKDHSKENIIGADLIVYTAAIAADNVEVIAAKDKGILTLSRAQLLGEIMKRYRVAVGVSGTHGKSTTTSLLSTILVDANLNPTALTGGILEKIKSNVLIGKGDIFVTEACEYTGTFLEFHPTIAVILNIDMDHPDFFRDIDHIEEFFTEYASIVPPDGYLVYNADDYRAAAIANDVSCHTISFSIDNDADLKAENICYNTNGMPSFRLVYKGQDLGLVNLNMPGRHSILNALAAAATAWTMGISADIITSSLQNFQGIKRRFEFVGEYEGIKIIDDYAHHPTAIKTTVQAILNLPHNKAIIVFQPHTYSRTIALFDDFVDALDGDNIYIINDIYAAREIDTGEVSSKMLADAMKKQDRNVYYSKSFEESAELIKKLGRSGDLAVTMGAGDIYKVGKILLGGK